MITFIIAIKYIFPREAFKKKKFNTIDGILFFASIYPVIHFFLAILAGSLYFRLVEKRKKKLIEDELERDKKALEKGRGIMIASKGEQLKWRLSRNYSRYQKIIDKAAKENILLNEYFLGEYPPDWEYRAKVVRRRDGYCCTKCGEKGVLAVHHIVPVKRVLLFKATYGSHYLDNLITLCEICHSQRHGYLFDDET